LIWDNAGIEVMMYMMLPPLLSPFEIIHLFLDDYTYCW